MKNLLVLTILISSFSANAMSFKKMKRAFRKASNITKQNIENVLDKTYVCDELFSDGTGGTEYLRLEKEDDSYLDSYTGNQYKLNKTLIAKVKYINGTQPSVIKITKSKDIVIKQRIDWLTHYTYCKNKLVRVGANLKPIYKSNLKIKAATIDSNDNLFVIEYDENTKKTYFTVKDKSSNVVSKVESKEFHSALGNDGYNGFAVDPKFIVRGEGVYLSGSFYNEDSKSKQLLIAVDKYNLLNSKILLEYKFGSITIGLDNMIYYTTHTRNPSGTRVVQYDRNGVELASYDYNEIRPGTYTLAAPALTGMVLASYCDNDYMTLYSCPERGINYSGISYVLNSGEVKWIDEVDKSVGFAMPVGFHTNPDGSFYVTYKQGHTDYNSSVYLYDKNGEYLNSWGLHARVNNSAVLMFGSDSQEQLQIINNILVTFDENTVSRFELK